MKLRICMLAAFSNLLLLGSAHAVAITATLASTVSGAPFALVNLGNAGTNGLVSTASVFLSDRTISFASGGSSGVYDGNVANVAASPLAASANYLVAEPGSAVTISYLAPQSRFQLLWGSVDDYNSLTFTRADGTALTITGADVRAIDGSDQSAYVSITGLDPFTKVVAASTSPAFEFIPSANIPEPGTLALVGAGLAGLVWMRRRAR